jgi:glycosyltransferase involved in cell wall biosynthesis
VADLSLDDVVTIIPEVVVAEDFLAASDVVVSVSDIEARPVVVTQAIQLRRPVVATATPGMSDLVCHGRSGLLGPINDFQVVRESLERVCDSTVRESLSASTVGELGVSLDYRWAHVIVELVDRVAARSLR